MCLPNFGGMKDRRTYLPVRRSVGLITPQVEEERTMLNALRASLLLLVLVGTAHAGEGYNPPAPQPEPASTQQEPSVEGTPDGATGTPETPAVLANAALELLAILPALI